MRQAVKLLVVAALLALLPQGALGSDPEIVFNGPRTPDGRDGIGIMDRDGSNVELIRETGAGPNWSPDGNTIVFSNSGDLLRIDLDTRVSRVIASGGGLLNNSQISYASLSWPVWSPRERPSGVGEIAASTWIAGTDGEARNVIVVTDEWGDEGVDLLYVSGARFQSVVGLTWSPDGTQIAIVERTETGNKLIRIDRDSGNVLPPIPTSGLTGSEFPDWSRKGGKIAFNAGSPRQNITIYVLDLDSGAIEPIVAGRFPSWSPDDTQLVFSTFNGKIKRYTFETGVVETLGAGHNPSWLAQPPCIEKLDCDPDELCCDGWCVTPACLVDADCFNGDMCTSPDTCENENSCDAYCDNTYAACGPADGCCGPGCDYNNDSDCPECIPTHSKEKGPRCSDGLDNDCDNLIDGDDADCG